MQTREALQLTDYEYAANVLQRGRGMFHSKERRDIVARILQQEGAAVVRTSVRNQQLHPEYVTDYVGTLETGFGNTQYQTFWSRLYAIEVTSR